MPNEPNELTPAEQAAAEAMADKQNRDELAAGYGAAAMPDDFADYARAVVAAVRGPIAAEILDQVADMIDQDGNVTSAQLRSMARTIRAAERQTEEGQ